MEFGQVAAHLLDEIQFTAPKFIQPSGVQAFGLPKTIEKVYTGCNMWGHKPWLGILYPPKTKEADMLGLYAKQFNAVELNATHYNFFPPAVFEGWAKKVSHNPAFKFCPKVPQAVSHAQNLPSQQSSMQAFTESLQGFGPHLGASFMQLPESFGANRWQELKQFLEMALLPNHFFVELRNESWYTESMAMEVQNFLKERQIGWLITDAAGKQTVRHGRITIPKLFVRFVASHGHSSTNNRLGRWAESLQASHNCSELYFFIHNHNENFSPSISKYWCELALRSGLPVKVPSLYTPEQTSLF